MNKRIYRLIREEVPFLALPTVLFIVLFALIVADVSSLYEGMKWVTDGHVIVTWALCIVVSSVMCLAPSYAAFEYVEEERDNRRIVICAAVWFLFWVAQLLIRIGGAMASATMNTNSLDGVGISPTMKAIALSLLLIGFAGTAFLATAFTFSARNKKVRRSNKDKKLNVLVGEINTEKTRLGTTKDYVMDRFYQILADLGNSRNEAKITRDEIVNKANLELAKEVNANGQDAHTIVVDGYYSDVRKG